MNLTLLTAPTVSVLTTDDLKFQARIFGIFDDDQIDFYNAAAAEKWHKDTKYVLCETEYILNATSLVTSEFELPLRPVIEVESINALVEDTDYKVSIDIETGIATIKFLTGRPNSVAITFKVGFSNPEDGDPSSVPYLIRLGILTLGAHYYNNREAFDDGRTEMKAVPGTYMSIVQSYRLA